MWVADRFRTALLQPCLIWIAARVLCNESIVRQVMATSKKSSQAEICQECGKQRAATISGSITAWIFKASKCACKSSSSKPSTSEVHSATGPVEQSLASPATVLRAEPGDGEKWVCFSGKPGVELALKRANEAAARFSAAAPLPSQPGSSQDAVFNDDLDVTDEKTKIDFKAPEISEKSRSKRLPQEGLPRQFGERYEIVDLIGEGGMACVYKVKDLVLDQYFSLKVIRRELAREKASQRRFEQEALAVRELNHANIVTTYASDISPEGIPYLIMDYVDGEDLGSILARQPLSTEVFFEAFNQVCSALAHAHSRGVIHRDMKPSNILLTNAGATAVWVKLVDFGIAKLIVPQLDERTQLLTRTGDFLGSPIYVSPEQAQGEEVDFRSDIYSLGCVMFHAIAGRPPFIEPSPVKVILQHINNQPPNLLKLCGESCSMALERVISKCLEKRPVDRYQNVFDLRTDLELIRAGKDPLLRSGIVSSQPASLELLTDWFDLGNEESKLNCVFEGRLSFDLRINNVLERIIELGCPGDSILRLESNNPDFTGNVVIRDGRQILGARIQDQSTQGYEALRKLVAMADGNFKYLSIHAEDYKLPDMSLYLNLNYILFLYPGLPESPSELLDQAALRDMVFALGPEESGSTPPVILSADMENVSVVKGVTVSQASFGIDGGAVCDEEDHWVPITPRAEKSSRHAHELFGVAPASGAQAAKNRGNTRKLIKQALVRHRIKVVLFTLFAIIVTWGFCDYWTNTMSKRSVQTTKSKYFKSAKQSKRSGNRTKKNQQRNR